MGINVCVYLDLHPSVCLWSRRFVNLSLGLCTKVDEDLVLSKHTSGWELAGVLS